MLVAFTLSVPTDEGARARANELEAPVAVAVMVAVWEEVTAATAALNDALVAYCATVTVEGTVTDELLLASVTA